MKKKVLALSIAAMIGGAANAGVSLLGNAGIAQNAGASVPVNTTATRLDVTPDGIGHQLFVPYFSTNAGNSTLLSLVNTDTTNGKAVKVRFRSAANSDDIFDFQIYMSPGDVWTANVSQGADGKSVLSTTDKSCTLPFSVNGSFITNRVPASLTDTEKAAWTREGYVEIFNMADIVDATATDDLFTRVKHVAGVAPCLSGAKAALLTALQNDPADITAAQNGDLNFRAPSTGLMGSWTIINIQGASVAWSGNMTALRANQANGAAGTGRIVFSPQTDAGAANVNDLTSDPLMRTTRVTTETVGTTLPILTAAMFDLPDMSTPYLVGTVPVGAVPQVPTGLFAAPSAEVVVAGGNTTGAAVTDSLPVAQANMVSGALAVTSVINEYLTDTSVAAATDWTFSMPTRRYGTAVNYNITTALKRAYTTGNVYFDANNTKVSGNLICVTNGGSNNLTSRDREEQTPSGGFVISPGVASSLEFCGEVSVLSFNSTNVLGASLAAKSIDATYRDGWFNVTLARAAVAGTTAGAGQTVVNGLPGLPIVGSAFVRATGPVVAGKSTNFGLTNQHRNNR